MISLLLSSQSSIQGFVLFFFSYLQIRQVSKPSTKRQRYVKGKATRSDAAKRALDMLKTEKKKFLWKILSLSCRVHGMNHGTPSLRMTQTMFLTPEGSSSPGTTYHINSTICLYLIYHCRTMVLNISARRKRIQQIIVS